MPKLGKLYTTNKNDPYGRKKQTGEDLKYTLEEGQLNYQAYEKKLDNEYIKGLCTDFRKANKKEINIMKYFSFTICCITENNNNEYRYLVGGRHKMEAIKILIEEGYNIGELLILEQNHKTFKEYTDFLEIMGYNYKIPIYDEIKNIYYKKLMNELKLKVNEQYKDAFRKNNDKYFNLDEFVNLFSEENLVGTKFIDKNNQINIKKILENLKKLNDKIKNEYNYEIMSQHTNNVVNKNNIFLTLKCVNIAELLKDPNAEIIIEPTRPIKRPRIPNSLQKKVWTKRFDKSIEGRCYCCEDTMISFGSSNSFQCGHIIAHSLGGPTTLENLEPICQGCNSGMGTRNLNDFKQQLIQSN